jgi:orotate phosphoribosyltransferase
MTNEEALSLFRKTGALLDGHFILRSGLHSRQFFQCALALQEMPLVERFGAALAEKVRALGVETVIAPAMGGLVIGFIFAEKENGALVLRRGFKIRVGERCLVVEDVVTKGGRALETVQIVQGLQGSVVGVAMVVDRSDGTLDLGVPLIPLIRLDVETFDPLHLPPDLAAIPATKPGSK